MLGFACVMLCRRLYIPLADDSWYDKLRLHQQHYRQVFNPVTCDVSIASAQTTCLHKVELMRSGLQPARSVATDYSVPLQRCLHFH